MSSPKVDEHTPAAADAEDLWVTAFLSGLEPPPVLTVSEWADQYRVLSGKMSAEAGPWRTSRTPYLREIMDHLSVHSPTERVVVMKGSRVGLTEAGNNWLGYVIHHAPGPMLYVEPRMDDARNESKQRIAPMLMETEVLAHLVASPRTRYGDNTLLMKEFPGGFLALTGANSAAGFRRIPCRYLFCDEIDGYPPDVGGEGDPVDLAIRRTGTFDGIRKILLVSTPTVKDLSRIEKEYFASDQRRLYVPCPHCGTHQVIIWSERTAMKLPEGPLAATGQIKWPADHPELAYLLCGTCGSEIDEAHKGAMLDAGVWRATAPENGPTVGYHLSALYSPPGWYSWGSAAADYLRALSMGTTNLQTWINTVLGEVWEEEGGRADPDVLAGRVAQYPENVRIPEGGLVLTAGIDVQDDRIEAEVVAWGEGEQSWGVEYRIIRGDTSRPDAWERLGQFLELTWRHEHGYPLPISCTCIDSGHRTREVYRFVGARKGRNVFAVKGTGEFGKGVIEAPRKKRTGTGQRHVDLWIVGDDQASSIVQGRIKIEKPGPGYCNFPDGYGYTDEHRQQITAMKVLVRYPKGRPRREWVVLPGRHNEAFDCRKYALAALYILNPDWGPLARNRRKKAAVIRGGSPGDLVPGPQPQLPSEPAPAQAVRPARPPKRHRPRGNWATGWR